MGSAGASPHPSLASTCQTHAQWREAQTRNNPEPETLQPQSGFEPRKNHLLRFG